MSPAAIGAIIIAIVIVLFVIMILVGVFMPRVFPDGKWGPALIAGTVVGTVIGVTSMVGGGLIYLQVYLQNIADPRELTRKTSKFTSRFTKPSQFYGYGQNGKGEDDPVMDVPDNYESESCNYNDYRGAYEDEYKADKKVHFGDRDDNLDDDFNELDYLEVDGGHEQDIAEKFNMFLEIIRDAENSEQLNKLHDEITTLKHDTENRFKDIIDALADKRELVKQSVEKLSTASKKAAMEILDDMYKLSESAQEKSADITAKLNDIKGDFKTL